MGSGWVGAKDVGNVPIAKGYTMKISHSMPDNVGKRPGRKVSKFTAEVHEALNAAAKGKEFAKAQCIAIACDSVDEATKVASAARSWAKTAKPFGDKPAKISNVDGTVTVYVK